MKYKITTLKSPGYMMVVYQDGHLKSILNEFKPPLTEKQLNIMLCMITDNHAHLIPTINANYEGKITAERVKNIGEEPPADLPDFPVNEKIALWCELWEEAFGIKYKTGAAEAGKLKAVPITRDELRFILEVYMSTDEWFTKPKSISNFVKKYNEVRVLAYAQPKRKNFKLPYDHDYYAALSLMDKRGYHEFLRENGYVFEHNAVRGGKWILKTYANQ